MKRELTGRGVLLWLIGFFVVIIAVNAGFIFLSVDTFRGEDEQKPYLQGIEFNQTLARRAAQARLGWRAEISAIRLASGIIRVAVSLRDSGGAPHTLAAASAELRHPSDENRDRRLALTQIAPGRYVADADGVPSGAWDVVITGRALDAPFEASRRLWVP
jgi:nitrogen fixation protein FixH